VKSGLFIAIGVMFLGCAGSVSQVTGEQAPTNVQKNKPDKEKKQAIVTDKPIVSTNKIEGQKKEGQQNNTLDAGQPKPNVSYGSGKELVQQAMVAANAGDLHKADSILSAGGTSSPLVKCNMAVIKYRLGRYPDAFKLARTAVQDMKDAGRCLKVAFDAGVAERNFNGLSNFLSGYVSKHPKSIVAANLAARLLSFKGRASEAVRRAKDLLKRDETNIDVMKTIAMAYMSMKRYDAAKFVIAQIQEIDKDDPDSMDMMGHILIRTNKKREAIAQFGDVIKAAPGMYDAWVQLGLLNLDAGDYQDAETQFRTAIKLMPGRVEAYINLGTLLTKMVRFDEARKVLNKALELSPDNPLAYFNLGIIELSDKPADMDRPEHYRKAISWFKKYQEHTKFLSGSDTVYKYMDEAKRMAKQQELLMQQIQQVPKEPDNKPVAKPVPEKDMQQKPAEKTSPGQVDSGKTDKDGKK